FVYCSSLISLLLVLPPFLSYPAPSTTPIYTLSLHDALPISNLVNRFDDFLFMMSLQKLKITNFSGQSHGNDFINGRWEPFIKGIRFLGNKTDAMPIFKMLNRLLKQFHCTVIGLD